MPTRSAYDLVWRATIRAAFGVLVCALWAGCVSTRLEDRDWVRIETTHYEIWSSLGSDASVQLAGELERFRSATEFVSGHAIPAAPLRTRVYAFDDRGIGRPFAYGSERSYLLPRQPGDVIVLRTGGGWDGDAWTPLKLEYARRLIWNASTDRLPPWLDEGLPQLASTLESRSDGALAGVLRKDHVERLRDSQWIPFDRLFDATDLASWSGLERGVFEAETWALCHYLLFDEGPIVAAGALARFQTQVRDGADPGAAARAEFGDPAKLQREVYRNVRTAEIDESALRIRWRGAKPTPHPVGQTELFEQLGALAVAIRNDQLALTYLEKAAALGASSARFLVGWGDAFDARGRSAEADQRYQAALAAAPDDPIVQLRYASRLRTRAESSTDPVERERLAAAARDHYARSVELESALAEAHAGYAAVHALDGQEPAASLEHARAARRLLPGDAEIGVLAAQIELALGDRASARRDAAREITRARTNPELEAARSLLAQIDERASIR